MPEAFAIQIGDATIGVIARDLRSEPFRFFASDEAYQALDGLDFDDAEEAERAARRLYASARAPLRRRPKIPGLSHRRAASPFRAEGKKSPLPALGAAFVVARGPAQTALRPRPAQIAHFARPPRRATGRDARQPPPRRPVRAAERWSI